MEIWVEQFLLIELATEIESSKWKPFRQALNKKDRKMFDEMMSYPRLYNSAGSNACRPQLIHHILITIIFEHYKQLNALEKAIKKVKRKLTILDEKCIIIPKEGWNIKLKVMKRVISRQFKLLVLKICIFAYISRS